MTSRWRAGLAAIAFFAAAFVSACGTSPLAPIGEDLGAPAPGGLRADALGQRTVRLVFARIPGLNQYRVERRDSTDGAFAQLAVIGTGQIGDTLIYVDTGVEPDRTYGYRISADSGVVSVVVGVRTPPPPGIAVAVRTEGLATFADQDGYLVTVVGPDSQSKRASVFFASGLPTSPPVPRVLFSPLRAGQYTVRISDLAVNCGIGSDFARTFSQTLLVTDSGIATVRTADVAVACEDPSLGAIAVEVAVANGAQSLPFEVRLTSSTVGAPVLRTLDVPGGGGLVQRRQLVAGAYQVELRGIRAPCRVIGTAVRAVTVERAQTDTVRYAVDCAQLPGGDFDPAGTDCEPGRPDRPVRFRVLWSQSTVAPGQEVIASVRAEPGTGGLPLGSASLTVGGFSGGPFEVLGLDPGADVVPTFANVFPPVVLTFASTNVNGLPLPAEIARVRLRARTTAVAGRFCTRTQITELTDPNGESFISQGVVLSDPVTIGTGGGTPPTTPPTTPPPSQLPPTAVIGGSATLSAQAGVAFQLSSAGSTDPSGSTLTYLWTLPGSTTPTSTSANPSVIYSTVGTFPITLTVRNAAGREGTATKNVVVVPASNNQPPQAGIDGAATLTALVGQPLVVTANSSRDPDGTIVAYRWTFPGGSPSTGVGIASSTTYSAPGTFTISLEVEDDRGGRSTVNKSVLVTAPVSDRPFVLSQQFSPIVGDTTTLTIRLDLSTNLLQTPQSEAWRRIFISSLTFDPTVIRPDALQALDGLNSGPTTFPEAAQGRISGLNANVIFGGRSGVNDVFRIRFRVLNPTGRTSTVVAGLSILPTPEAGAGIVDNYAPFTRVEDGLFPPSGSGPPPPTQGTVRGTLIRTGSGTQALGGVSVVVAPSGGSPVTATVTATATGATYSAAGVPGGSTGSVQLTNLPSGCTAPASTPYPLLAAGATLDVNISVACTPPAPPPSGSATAVLTAQFSAVTAGSADLAISVSTAGCDPALNAACPANRNFASVLGTIVLEGTAVGRVTGRSSLGTPSFGAATLGGTLPTIVYTAVTTTAPTGFTSTQTLAALRLTFAAGASGSLATRSRLDELSDANGDPIALTVGSTLTITEASTTIP